MYSSTSQRKTRAMTMASMTDFEFWSYHVQAILKKMERQRPHDLKAFLIAEIAKVPKKEATGPLGGDPHLECILNIRLRKKYNITL